MIRKFLLRQFAGGFVSVNKTEMTHTPDEMGLTYEKVAFKTEDGVTLRGWFMACEGSQKVVIANHYMGANKGGIPKTRTNNVHTNFIPTYKNLVDGGYNVLAYDLRNHGESDQFNEGKLGMGLAESPDIIASMDYVRSRFPDYHIYLQSMCFGCCTTMHAMKKYPKAFEDVKAFVALQPLSANAFVEAMSKHMRIWRPDNLNYFDEQLYAKTGYHTDVLEMANVASAVKVPTLLVQVHRDIMTLPSDLERIHDNFGTEDKKLFWIEDTDKRLEGYNYFGRKPEEMLSWLDSH